MTHGYEYFLFDYVDLDEFYVGDDEYWQREQLDEEIDKTWSEIKATYDMFED